MNFLDAVRGTCFIILALDTFIFLLVIWRYNNSQDFFVCLQLLLDGMTFFSRARSGVDITSFATFVTL